MQSFLLRVSIPRWQFLFSSCIALFILLVIFGALLTRQRLMLRWLHISCLVWGILTELLPAVSFDRAGELAGT